MVLINYNTDLDLYKSENCFIIKYENEKILNEILFKIKKSKDVEIYAKPILLLNEYDKKIENYFAQSVDKVIDSNYFYNAEYDKDVMVSNIISKVNLLKHNEVDDVALSFKILRYIYTRGDKLTPYQSIHNKYGYSYPQIDHMLSEEGDNQLFESLDYLANQRLLEPIFYDKCHFCSECYSAFLNFKEVCPRCYNSDLKNEPLLHHFECAYVGLESEFKQGNKFICPKCDKELFHIGVDYDKPSMVNTCKKCGYEFQDALVQGSCFNCRSVFDVDNLILRDVYEYELTVLSENSALFGFKNIFSSILEDNLDILPLKIFNRYMSIELERIKRYKKTVSSLVVINLNDMNKIYQDANSLESIKNIFTQISQVIQNFLRNTDLMTSFNDVMYGVLLVETPLDGAKIATSRLQAEIEELLEVNIKKKYEIEIKLKEITENNNLNELMEFFE